MGWRWRHNNRKWTVRRLSLRIVSDIDEPHGTACDSFENIIGKQRGAPSAAHVDESAGQCKTLRVWDETKIPRPHSVNGSTCYPMLACLHRNTQGFAESVLAWESNNAVLRLAWCEPKMEICYSERMRRHAM